MSTKVLRVPRVAQLLASNLSNELNDSPSFDVRHRQSGSLESPPQWRHPELKTIGIRFRQLCGSLRSFRLLHSCHLQRKSVLVKLRAACVCHVLVPAYGRYRTYRQRCIEEVLTRMDWSFGDVAEKDARLWVPNACSKCHESLTYKWLAWSSAAL